MSVGIHRVIERERFSLAPVHRFGEVAELGRQPARANELQIIRISIVAHAGGSDTGVVRRRAATNHVHVQLRDDRIARDCGMVGKPLGSVKPFFLADVPHE